MVSCVVNRLVSGQVCQIQPRGARPAASGLHTHRRSPAHLRAISRHTVAYSVSEPSKDGEEADNASTVKPTSAGPNGTSTSAKPQAAKVVAAESSQSTATSPPPASSSVEKDLDTLKLQLLAAVSSLDRGIAANAREAADVDGLASELEEIGGLVQLEWKTSESSPDSSTMDKLEGTWRLIYSSGFNTGSLGGRRPGPPAAFVPLVLGQVYQRINNNTSKLDNIVEFLFSYPLPSLPFLPSSTTETPVVRLTLGHDFSVRAPSTIEIVYEDTAAQLQGTQLLDAIPRFDVPNLPEFLRPPRFLRSATFNVTFLDSMMRITRGDRGELRIYLKDEDLVDSGSSVPVEVDYVD